MAYSGSAHQQFEPELSRLGGAGDRRGEGLCADHRAGEFHRGRLSLSDADCAGDLHVVHRCVWNVCADFVCFCSIYLLVFTCQGERWGRRRSALMKPLVERLTLLGAALACASCTVLGPDFTSPREATPKTYDGTAATFNPAGAPEPSVNQEPDWHWWMQFNDAELDHLEQQAVAGNLDLQVALLRIIESRAQVQIARAQGLPNVKATASAEREQLGLAGILKSQGNSSLTSSPQASGLISSLEQPITLYQVGFDVHRGSSICSARSRARPKPLRPRVTSRSSRATMRWCRSKPRSHRPISSCVPRRCCARSP